MVALPWGFVISELYCGFTQKSVRSMKASLARGNMGGAVALLPKQPASSHGLSQDDADSGGSRPTVMHTPAGWAPPLLGPHGMQGRAPLYVPLEGVFLEGGHMCQTAGILMSPHSPFIFVSL